MKMRKTILARMLEKGMIHMNEAAAESSAEAVDTSGGGGEAIPVSDGAEDTGTSDSAIDWGSLSEQFSADEGEEAAPSSEEAATDAAEAPPAEEGQVEQPPETPPAEPKAEEEQPPVEPEEPAEPAVEPQQEPEARTPEQIEAEKAEVRGQWLGELTQRYQLSDEQAALMQTDPNAVFPEMAAQLHVGVMESMMQVMQQMMPQFVRQTVQGDAAAETVWQQAVGCATGGRRCRSVAG